MSLLEFIRVSAFRGSKQVFRDLNLCIQQGVSTAILGPNGSGKTTLLKLAAREIYPAQGTVKIFDQERWDVWQLRKRLGLVSQDLQNNYLPLATGLSVVISGFFSSLQTYRHQAVDPAMIERATEVIHDLEIETLADRPLLQMSSGQQRRFLLARALVNRPDALLLDEPTSGLDLPAQFQFFATMQHLIRSGKTVIVVTHSVPEILPEIRRVVLLKDGQVMLHDEKEKVLTRQNLSEAYQTNVQVIRHGDYFQVIPAT